MQKYLLLIMAVFTTACSFGQKPVIDTAVFGRWPAIYGGGKISRDGRYLSYSIRGASNESRDLTLVLAAAKTGWKKELPSCTGGEMLLNDKEAIYRTRGDSLFLLRLGTEQRKYVGHAASYRLLRDKHENEWLIWQEPGSENRWFIRESKTGKTNSEKNVASLLFNDFSGTLLLDILSTESEIGSHSLFVWNLVTGEKKLIWKGRTPSNYVFDDPGEQIAFFSKDSSGLSIWYYKKGMAQAEKRVCDTTAGIESNMALNNTSIPNNNALVFSHNGKDLFFPLIKKVIDKKTTPFQVDVWNYQDQRSQNAQLGILSWSTEIYLAVLLTEDDHVRQILHDDETMSFYIDLKNCNQYVVVKKNGNNGDAVWKPETRESVYLESVKDGKRLLLKDHIPYLSNNPGLDFTLSPDEKYVIYFDPFEKNYFSYEIESGITRNLTKDLNTRWDGEANGDWGAAFDYAIGIAGWMEKGKELLVYDAFDIWRLDPSGIKKPFNLTNGYGTTHHTRFRIAQDADLTTVPPGKTFFLFAFDTATKYSGFYGTSPDPARDPVKLTMGPYKYHLPVKADKADVWLVTRESAMEAPNFFITENWKQVRPLTNISPQENYNWLRSELVTWSLPDGSRSQGILCKPENFDSTKKYPMLIDYYEIRSNELYTFRIPEAAGDRINIPWYVSRGYLVFVPDIHYQIGHPGESVLNTILSGVRFISQNPWIDSMRVGLQGHSHGGWETNYLVTHTHLFAAAVEASGASDLISMYGYCPKAESNIENYYESQQGRIGVSLGERPDLYTSNSPIFRAAEVTTPLLMMNNKRDDLVPWTQGIEFFMLLRRMGKRAWMLQYDRGGHGVDGDDAIDYTIRMTQFFDHYLKGAPTPKWMTEGIPAKLKGIETGYELDTSGKEPQEQQVLFDGKIQLVRDTLSSDEKIHN